MPEPFILFL